MTGRVGLYDIVGELIRTKKFNYEAEILPFLEKQKRLYGMGWKRIEVRIEYDEKQVSPKKKQPSKYIQEAKKYSFKKHGGGSGRRTTYGMYNDH